MLHTTVLLGGKAYGQLKDAQFKSLEEINEVLSIVVFICICVMLMVYEIEIKKQLILIQSS